MTKDKLGALRRAYRRWEHYREHCPNESPEACEACEEVRDRVLREVGKLFAEEESR